MRKKTDVADLRLGMYVEDLDRPWTETPYLLQGVHLRTFKDLEEIQRLCRYVYVDSDRSFIIDTPEEKARDVPTLQLHPPRKVPKLPIHRANYEDSIAFEEEVPRAANVHHQVKALLENMEHDVRSGHSIDSAATRAAVTLMVESVVRNPDAMMWHTQLKRKDEYTALHSLNVCVFALAFGRHLGLSRDMLNELGLGALLHDVGKLRIPLEILNKAGPLSEKEMELMRRHPLFGAEVLRQSEGLSEQVIDIARSHHERADGSGYPHGLTLEKIGPLAQLVSVVDYYDAMTSDRVYRDGVASTQVTKLLYETRGHLFEARVVEEFIRCLGIFPVGSLVELHSGEVGIVVSLNRRWHLRPKLLLVLDAQKHPYQPVHMADLATLGEHVGTRQIAHALEPGSYGVNVRDYVPEVNPGKP